MSSSRAAGGLLVSFRALIFHPAKPWRALCNSNGAKSSVHTPVTRISCHGTVSCPVLERQFAAARWKHTFHRGKGTSKAPIDEDLDDEDVDEKDVDPSLLDDVDGQDTKIIKSRVSSLRLDSVLKAGLGVSKSKIETAFYESRIRVNGEKIFKKSKQLHLGDEVDVIRGYNSVNPKFLDVSRVIVVAVEEGEAEKIPVILKRYKLMTIENYAVPFKRAVSD